VSRRQRTSEEQATSVSVRVRWLVRSSERVHCTHSSSSPSWPDFRVGLGARCPRALRRGGVAEDDLLRRIILRPERVCRRGIFRVRSFGSVLGTPRRQAWRRADSSSGSREESSSGGESREQGGTSRGQKTGPSGFVLWRRGEGRDDVMGHVASCDLQYFEGHPLVSPSGARCFSRFAG